MLSHHPDVVQHMIDCTTTMLNTFDFDGITWDELKTLHETDYHPLALELGGGKPPTREQQIQATLDVFAKCNEAARAIKPDIHIISFIYAQMGDEYLIPWSKTPGFDQIGPDGKVFRTEDYNKAPEDNKVLIEHGPRFLEAAKAAGRGSFALIETQFDTVDRKDTLMKRLPEFLTMGYEHIAAYYRPLVREPEAECTEELSLILRDWRRGKDFSA